MASIVLEFSIVLLLILLNGVLAMAEISVVSARKTRLQQQAEAGIAGAQSALELANAPSNLLSTVQIGITLVGILAGAFGGATLADYLADWFGRIGFLQAYANTLAVGVVVVLITYLSLVIGELAPKQVGLAYAERVAAIMAPPMIFLSKLTSPVVAFLNVSTSALLRIFRFRPSTEPEITEEEIKIVIEQGTETGVLQPIEEEIVSQVFRLSDQRIGTLMTPRREVTWIDLNDSIETIKATLATGVYAQYPVAHDSLDDVIGTVRAKDLLAQCVTDQPLDLLSILQPALFIPEGMPVYNALEQFKQHKTQMALVIDEFGGVQGMVSTSDILEEIVGEFPDVYTLADPDFVQREDGSWLLDGMISIPEFKARFDIDELPEERENLYQTLGGFVMTYLGSIPKVGDVFDWEGIRFEVVDMDGFRVDKILVKPVEGTQSNPEWGKSK